MSKSLFNNLGHGINFKTKMTIGITASFLEIYNSRNQLTLSTLKRNLITYRIALMFVIFAFH
ncbi:hypothetical protein MB14_18260 [Roseivirga ehrenbergii]|uniref:Uncharacterized protein n=1 Tax=Roseivirga ehrenbergii (strain DSM 102268 / JCM 13514 / KCTC 12282 / NCIMB 14502 / KMM 6017) TaxID=279360 RepID=A0A150XJ33_ROSEK|nr:hypothetical protein MB14_18260 [Roseivirga ehrenbergii]